MNKQRKVNLFRLFILQNEIEYFSRLLIFLDMEGWKSFSVSHFFVNFLFHLFIWEINKRNSFSLPVPFHR